MTRTSNTEEPEHDESTAEETVEITSLDDLKKVSHRDVIRTWFDDHLLASILDILKYCLLGYFSTTLPCNK